jgi:predicted RNA-binding protein with PUA-like domain
MSKRYWLLKTEPDTFSYEDLISKKVAPWDGVRNYQARNFIKEMKKNDLAFIYHTGQEKSVVGIAQVVSEYYPEIVKSEPNSSWVQIDIVAEKKLKKPISLDEMKKNEKH